MKKISDKEILQDLEDLESIESVDSAKVLRYPRKRGARSASQRESKADSE